jgi:WD40 repeat protein
MRNILLEMVQPGDGVADTRRMARRSEISAEDWQLVLSLADKRLVVINTTPDGQEIAEIAHEALIQNWEQLQNWMKADRSFRAWKVRLRSALRQWEENSQDMGGLLRGMPLAEAKRWLHERDQQIIGKERDFLFQSLLLEGSELQEWIPRYGTVEETLAFITPYTSSNVPKKIISVNALKWLPHTSADNEIYDLLLQLALEDPSPTVRKKATQCICERGHASELAQLLAPKKLTKQKKQRLTKSLASVRNVPKVGYELEKVLRYSKRRILFAAMLELIYSYRNQFAIILFFSYIIGQILILLINAIFGEISFSNRNSLIDLSRLDINIFSIVITLSLCLYIYIRRSHIDDIKLSVRHCITASLYFLLSFDFTYLIYACIAYIFVKGDMGFSTHYISLIVSHLLPDAVALPIIAQVLRTNLSGRGAIWKLLWTAIVGIGLLIATEEFLVSQISFLADHTQFFTSKSTSYDIFTLRQSFYYALQSLQSTFATLIVGVFAGFGSLLGLRFGFLSAFNSKNQSKVKPDLRLSIMTLLSSKRQKELSSHLLDNKMDLQSILSILPKSFYLVTSLALLGPFFTSQISHLLPLPQPLSSNSLYDISQEINSQDSISFSPNGKLTAYLNDDAITVLNTMTGKKLYKYSGHPISTGHLNKKVPDSAIWSPDSTKLTATFKYDDTDFRTAYQEEIWDSTTGTTLYILPFQYTDYGGIQWSPNNKYITRSIYDGSVEVRDATTGKSLYTHRSSSIGSSKINWSPDSTHILLSSDQTIEIWDVVTGDTSYIRPPNNISTDSHIDVGWSPNGKYIVIMVYRNVSFMRFSTTLEIRDSTNNFKVLHQRVINSDFKIYIYWSPNSKYIAIVANSGVKIWETLSGNDLYTYLGHIHWVNDMAWSSDSKRVASASTDGSIQVWDITTGSNVNTYCVYPAEANYWNIIIGKDDSPYTRALIKVNWVENTLSSVSVDRIYKNDNQSHYYYTIYNWQIT